MQNNLDTGYIFMRGGAANSTDTLFLRRFLFSSLVSLHDTGNNRVVKLVYDYNASPYY